MKTILKPIEIEYLSKLKEELCRNRNLTQKKNFKLLGHTKELLLGTLINLMIKIDQKEFLLTDKYKIYILSIENFRIENSCCILVDVKINFSELVELMDGNMLEAMLSSIQKHIGDSK